MTDKPQTAYKVLTADHQNGETATTSSTLRAALSLLGKAR